MRAIKRPGDFMPLGEGITLNIDADNLDANNLYKMMYRTIRKIDVTPCSRRLNGIGQFGCGG